MYNSDLPSRADLPTSRQLIRSTVVAAAVAVFLLVAVVLPSEYGIDPTGIGRALGLTEMGEIKQQLAAEAADATPSPADAPANASPDSVNVPTSVDAEDEQASEEPQWRDELQRTLNPAEGKEIKLRMQRGEEAHYEWSVDRGHLNSDLHTDNGPDGKSHSYRRGRAETEDQGNFVAISEGSHGWFWRNRSNETVTVTVRIRGTYQGLQ